jgi:hypothetical protein
MVPVCHWHNILTWLWKYAHIVKIGISDDVGRRKSEVEADIQRAHGNRVMIIAFKIPFLSFYEVEQKLLQFTARFYGRAEMPGAGKTEWRLSRNWITGLSYVYLLVPMTGHKAEIWHLLVFVFLPVPLDFYLLALLAFLLELLAVVAVVFVCYFIYSHLTS